MGGSFGGLNTALTALHAQRRGLDVAGQNVANANTVGYSRQRVDLAAVGGPSVPAVWSISDGTGSGVSITDIARVRDDLLEARGRAESTQNAYLTGQAQVYSLVENAFAEPSDTGLQSQLASFWNGWSEVSNMPAEAPARSMVIREGAGVADTLRGTYQALESQWSTMRGQIAANVTAVNTAAIAVGKLNETIVRAEAAGLPANELSDQRDLFLMEISQLTGASVNKRLDGSVDVLIGGSSLVNGPHVRELRAAGTTVLANAQGTDRVRLEWVDPANPTASIPATVSGGTIAGSLEAMGDVIPRYTNGLNDIAKSLADTFNTQHRLGYGQDNVNGRDFFGGDSAMTIEVVRTNVRELAVASLPNVVNGDNADALAAVGRGVGGVGGVDALYRGLVVQLGVNSQGADRRADIQAKTLTDINALRAADSGVNLDEEMVNLVMFQRAYEAAARVMTSVDGALDTLINRTGLVGR